MRERRLSDDIAISRLLDGQPVPQLDHDAQYMLRRYPVQEGMELILWRTHLSSPREFYLYDDSGRINFSCILNGKSRIIPDMRRSNNECVLETGTFYISHTSGCRGKAFYEGVFESITLSIDPIVLKQCVPDVNDILQQCEISYGYCQRNNHSAEIHGAAQMLWNALINADERGGDALATMWQKGQSLVMLSLMLEKHMEIDRCVGCPLRQPDRQKLMKAKALLLSDLTKAPTITELARETGLSVLKVKKGFRSMFNNSVYGLFQAERMQEARRRLLCDNVSVMTVASDLGYANASHFSAAFQKQFGVLPSVFKRSIHVDGMTRL
ncbi:helix-turn-helix transcriptional regulator [Zymobacter sp. IVIA_5232.4 C2]|uniref:helix-turn-helix transcriptional regulator n=1 Tax=Zymobacter sp. IVIA_5232.4 C2 TaxID=3394855 RepID=UPI0039C4CD35